MMVEKDLMEFISDELDWVVPECDDNRNKYHREYYHTVTKPKLRDDPEKYEKHLKSCRINTRKIYYRDLENSRKKYRELHRKYREENREEYNAYRRKYREKNKEKINTYRREYRRKNREKMNKQERERRARRKNTNTSNVPNAETQ